MTEAAHPGTPAYELKDLEQLVAGEQAILDQIHDSLGDRTNMVPENIAELEESKAITARRLTQLMAHAALLQSNNQAA